MAQSQTVEVDGRELKLTNLDKVLYPAAGFTKGEMVDYYAKVADALVQMLTGGLFGGPASDEELFALVARLKCAAPIDPALRQALAVHGPDAARIIGACYR